MLFYIETRQNKDSILEWFEKYNDWELQELIFLKKDALIEKLKKIWEKKWEIVNDIWLMAKLIIPIL